MQLVSIHLKLYNKGTPTQTICLRYFPKLLKSLIYRALSLIAEYFLLRLKTVTMYFKFNIFYSNLTCNNVYEKLFSEKYRRLLPEYESITNIFVGIVSSPKIWKNGLWWSHVLIKQNYSLQPKTLLNFVTDAFMRVLWNYCTENFGKYPGKCM